MDFKINDSEIKKLLYKEWNKAINKDISSTNIEDWVENIVYDIVEIKFSELYEYDTEVDNLFKKSSASLMDDVFKNEISHSLIQECLKIALSNRLSELSFNELKELINNVEK